MNSQRQIVQKLKEKRKERKYEIQKNANYHLNILMQCNKNKHKKGLKRNNIREILQKDMTNIKNEMNVISDIFKTILNKTTKNSLAVC